MLKTQGDTEWLAQEIDEASFKDRRLGRRFREFMVNFWKNIGSTIPLACQDWAGTKAAYRFLSNPHVGESAILQGHFESTRRRIATLKNETSDTRCTSATVASISNTEPGRVSAFAEEPANARLLSKKSLSVVRRFAIWASENSLVMQYLNCAREGYGMTALFQFHDTMP